MSFPMRLAQEINFDSEPGKQMHMFERKRGAGNEDAGSKGILVSSTSTWITCKILIRTVRRVERNEIKMADAMSLFLLRLEIWLLMTNLR